MEQAVVPDLFEAAFASLDVGVVVEDLDGRVLAANATAERLLGDDWTAIHENGWPLADEACPARVALRTGSPCTGMTLGIKKGGSELSWVVASAHPLPAEPGARPWAVATSYTDITQAHNDQHAERRAAERFRSLIEYSSDVITILDEQGHQTYESAAIERLLGYAPGDFEGPSRITQIHRDDVGRVSSTVAALLERPGSTASAEYRIRARDGSWRIVESVATNRLHDPDVQGIVVNTRDLTERRREQAVLLATTSRLTSLVQNMKSGVLVEDEQRRIALVNADFCSIFGVKAPPNVLVGGDCVAAAARLKDQLADPDRFTTRIEELIGAREPVTGEEVAFADGRTFERDYVPIDVEGANRGHLWLYRDISERKAAEREAARARDEAIRASRVKSDFLATVSHEIRTPMNGVIGTIDLLLDTTLSTDQRELAAVIRDSAHGLLGLIDDVLDLSKIEADKLEPKEVGFDLAAVVEGVADVLLSSARRKGLTLTTYADPRASATLRGDAQWLRQVLVNLLGNAVKFTGHGGARVRAELVSETPRSATIRFAVSDSGPGIPDAARQRLFEPFAQLGGAAGGTGLGLAICQRLVGLMGGEIAVRSRPGAGSTFSFTLTFERAEPAPVPACAFRVLLLESCDATAAVIEEYGRAWGMDVIRAASAADALTLIGAGPFDVAILGAGVAEHAEPLRAAPGGEQLAFVLLKDVGHEAPASAAFATELNRPVKRRRLFEAITSAPAPAAEPPEAPSFRPPPGTRVLVAEDDDVNRELMVRQLAKLGVAAHDVSTGGDAIRLAGDGGYDVVLMDCQMPGVDGLQAARAIRALEPTGIQTAIIAVTGGATTGEVEASLAAGMDACLTKPFSTTQLADVLARVMPAPGGGSALDALRADVGDEESVRRIARLFVSGLRDARAQLAAALEHGDATALGNAAHRLRSSSATFGANRLAALSARLESQSATGSPEGAGVLVRAIAEETERVTARVDRELAQGSPSSR